MYLRFLFFLILFYFSKTVLAENKNIDHNSTHIADTLEEAQTKELSPKEKAHICQTWKNKFIGYYSDVYFVNFINSKCSRLKLNHEQIKKMTGNKEKIHPIDSIVIEALDLGGMYQNTSLIKSKEISFCDKYNNKYITYAHVDFYWVEDCSKRKFPDSASYENHRGSLKKARPLISIEEIDFHKLQVGLLMPSVIDKEFRELLSEENNDLIPIDEACEGIKNKHVSYSGHIYFIRPLETNGACEKMIIDAEKFTRENASKSFQLKVLSSSQARSIPDA